MKKQFRHCRRIKMKPSLENLVLIFRGSCLQMFFKIGVLKNFVILEPLSLKLQAFFYRTPTLAASGSSRQQMLFPAKSGMYWRQSHRSLSWTPLKTQVKPQKQPLQLFCKKRCSQQFCKFSRNTPVQKSLFNKVAGQETQTQMFSRGVYESLKSDAYERLLMEPALSAGVSVVISYTSGSNQYILVHGSRFVIFVTVSFANFSFVTSTTDTAIIRSSRLVVFWQKGVLTNFAKFTRKHLRKGLIFNEAADLQSLNLSK